MKLLHRVTRASCYCFLLVLPVGIYMDDPASVDYHLGVHAGGGQVASVLTSCGGVDAATGSNYVDVGAEGYLRLPPKTNSPIVVGLRGGYWHSNLNLILPQSGDIYTDYPSQTVDYSFEYLNPNISFESHYVGFGVGYIFGEIPQNFKDSRIDTMPNVSGHLRVGSMRGINVSMNLAENSPYVSGGGVFDLGISFPLSDQVRTRVAVSTVPYYTAGFLSQTRIRLKEKMAVDFNWRVGSTSGELEYGVSAGVVYQFGGS